MAHLLAGTPENQLVFFADVIGVCQCAEIKRSFSVGQVYDLGADGQSMSRVATMSQNSIVTAAGNIARSRHDEADFTFVFCFFTLLLETPEN